MLELRKITGAYGPVKAVDEVSLSVAAGEILGLMGRNGAGKTTLLKTIMGLVPKRTGSLLLEGEELIGLPAHAIPRRGIAYVPQGRRLFSELTVAENLRMGLLVKDAPQAEAERVLDLFPILRERLSQAAGTLSGGEQQMVAVARALCAQPKVLLLDEPSEGLIPAVTHRILDTVAALRERGVAILLVEQQVKSALRICDRIALIENGTIQHEAPARDLAADPVPLERYIGVHR
ncbi:ABC transporter ATP-binding protein [Dongia sedimenti]|uniref:ABC transporter ATP-binding protein n=1 Tax=Dongia sedimenti TaxID=3064282 RepID=A0ABU0YIN2_9PROT|nr:ABC transporter ATP-binding protein [Rhodospirillaceae bacterium R-7]